jgi:malate dehydrogenase (oxaloacetate-decarboxylating)(NADP+)
VPRQNIWVTDLAGVVYEGRTELMDPDKVEFAQPTDAPHAGRGDRGRRRVPRPVGGWRAEAGDGGAHGRTPLIFALANPTPEIMPEEVKAVRDDAIMATGRTDYPNQVNNVLCFPYIFRGALDCGATTITDADGDRRGARHRRAGAGRAERHRGRGLCRRTLSFGPEYLIPKPFDPRLMMMIAPAVAQAGRRSGVAQRPVADLAAYREKLQTFVYASGTTMKPIFAVAKRAKRKNVAYAEGEDRARAARRAGHGRRRPGPALAGRPRRR